MAAAIKYEVGSMATPECARKVERFDSLADALASCEADPEEQRKFGARGVRPWVARVETYDDTKYRIEGFVIIEGKVQAEWKGGRGMQPTADELRQATAWCERRAGARVDLEAAAA